MTTSSDFLMLTGVVAVLLGLPVSCIAAGMARRAKWLVLTGVGILCIYGLVAAGYVASVGPDASGIVAHGESPQGREYCIVQTYKQMAEPYQVSFYIRDAAGVWRWNYLAHQDAVWRSATASFSNGMAHVTRDGVPVRDIPVPMKPVDLMQGQPGYDCPSNFTVDEVLSFHNRKYEHRTSRLHRMPGFRRG